MALTSRDIGQYWNCLLTKLTGHKFSNQPYYQAVFLNDRKVKTKI